MSTTEDLSRKVWCYLGDGDDPHEIVLELNDSDTRAWYAAREREDRLPKYAYGERVTVTNQADGGRYVLRTAPCGGGCRCAAQATPLEDAGRLFVGDECTIDGKPATVTGRQLDFGIVAELPHGLRVEFAWPTIARIMDNGGRFKS